jgi:beta-lactamase class C
MIGKSVILGAVILFVFSFSTLDLGSITDGSYEIKSAAFVRSPKPEALDSLVNEYDRFLSHAVDSLQSPGAAIALVYKGEILLLKGYGVKKVGSNDSIDSHTAFRLGSVSKGFASVLTGIMVEEGSLSWDDKVKKYITDFNMKDTACANHLTIRHILSQTSGFPEHTYTDLLDDGMDYETIKASLSNVPVVAKPGQIYTYQNVVYSLIADILYNATGKDYNNLLLDKIFLPLNMHDASTDYTSFYYNPNTAMPHLRMGNNWKMKPKNSRYYSVSPASGVNASASDMSKWLLALTGYYPEVLHQKTIADIASHNIETPRKSGYSRNWKYLDKTYYGLGWRVFNIHGHDVVYHGGYVEGYRTEIAFDPDSKVGIAILFNSNTSLASQCIPKFLNSFLETCCPNGSLPIYAEKLQ